MVGELGVFATVVQNLNQLGFYGFVLPWLLVFGVVYGILQKSGILGGKPRVDGIVSFVIAFFVTGYTNIGTYFVSITGLGAMLITALLVAVMFFALVGFQVPELKTGNWALFIVGVGLVLFWIVGGGTIAGISLSNEAWAAILMIVVIAIAIWFVSEEKKG
jgi:hypothetical protein